MIARHPAEELLIRQDAEATLGEKALEKPDTTATPYNPLDGTVTPGDPPTPGDPVEVRDILEGMAEYKIRFADRLHKHFFNDGALTPVKNSVRHWECSRSKIVSDTGNALPPIDVNLRKWGVRAVEIQAGFFGEFKFKFK